MPVVINRNNKNVLQRKTPDMYGPAVSGSLARHLILVGIQPWGTSVYLWPKEQKNKTEKEKEAKN